MDFVKNKNLAILDVETTGIKAGSHKIIELYILKVLNEKVVDDYYSKFNPKQNIPLFISNLTGIYQWHVEAAPIIDDEILNIKNFVSDSIIIGHNLKFDLSFLNYALTSNNLQKFDNETIDTLNLSRALVRSKVKNHKLVTLSKYFKTVNQNEHNSKADVLTTYEVFKNLAVFDQIKDKKDVESVNYYLNSGMRNMGGIRWLKTKSPSREGSDGIILLTNHASSATHNPWDDEVNHHIGNIQYWGDAKHHQSKSLDDFEGNKKTSLHFKYSSKL